MNERMEIWGLMTVSYVYPLSQYSIVLVSQRTSHYIAAYKFDSHRMPSRHRGNISDIVLPRPSSSYPFGIYANEGLFR